MEWCDEGTLRGYLDYNAAHNETINLATIRHISQAGYPHASAVSIH